MAAVNTDESPLRDEPWLDDATLAALADVAAQAGPRPVRAAELARLLAGRPGTTAARHSVALRWRVDGRLTTLACDGPLAALLAAPEPAELVETALNGERVDLDLASAERTTWTALLRQQECARLLLLPLPLTPDVPPDGLLALYAEEPVPWAVAADERQALVARLVHTALAAEPAPLGETFDLGYRQAVERIHANRDPEDACRRAAAELERLLLADWVVVARCDESALRFDCHLPIQRYSYSAVEAPVLSEAAALREALDGPPSDDLADLLSQRMKRLGIARALTVPLVFNQQLFGVVQVGFRRPDSVVEQVRQRLDRLAFHVAMALRDAGLLLNQEEAMARLRRAQHEATEGAKFRALAQMAGGVAHEFNNALGGILGRAQMLQRQTRDHRIQKGLRTIFEIGWRAAETVRRLQDFTRERSESDLQGVPAAQLWDRLVDTGRAQALELGRLAGARCQLDCDHGPLDGVLQANPDELVEALGNVLLNAFEATPGGGTVTLHGHVTGDHLYLSVVDRGRGMSPEEQQSIFDPFYSTKAETGVGLGLSVTYGIISRHRGEIEVESTPGRGTTVSITLPLSATSEVSPPAAERVLVIDDETALCEVLAELFTGEGFQVDTCAGGREGIERFNATAYDLVCTDLRTEDISGWEVIRAVKESGRGTPVMLLTGFRDQLRQDQIDQSGVDIVLGKPFTLQQVMDAANGLLGR